MQKVLIYFFEMPLFSISKFIELCSEDTPMVRRAVAAKLGVRQTDRDRKKRTFYQIVIFLNISFLLILNNIFLYPLQELAQVIEKEFVLTDLISSIKQLMSDEQDMVRVRGLQSLKMVAKVLKKDENKQHTLPIIIAATEDKSWRVRLELSKIFSEVET